MNELFRDALEVLAQFGGGRGDPGNNVVRFLLPSVFWLVIAYVVLRQWRITRERRDLYIGVAAVLGLGREILMFVVFSGDWLGFLPQAATHYFYPPIEHAISVLAMVVVGFAFLQYYLERRNLWWTYLALGVAAALVLYLVAAPAWASYLREHPQALYGQHWGDMAFRITGTILAGTALAFLLVARLRGVRTKWPIVVAFLFFFLDDGLMIVNLATGEVAKETFAPIRHNLHIWAIPLILAVYWMEVHTRLSEAEKVRDSVFDLSPSMLCVADFSGLIKVASPASARIIGLAPEALAGRTLTEFGCPAEIAKALATAPSLNQKLQAMDFECRWGTQDGQDRWLHWRIQPVADEQLLYAVVSEVTDRKLAEEEREKLAMERVSRDQAERHAAQLDALLNNLAEGVAVVDVSGRVMLINPLGRELLGLSPDDAVRGIEDFSHLDLRRLDGSPLPATDRPFDLALSGETFIDQEVILVDSEGSQRRLVFSGSAVRDDGDRPTLAINVYRDVTQLRQLEQTREEYIHTVSHDLRAPLTTIVGKAQLLQIALARAGQSILDRGNTKAIVVSAHRMSAMIQDMVDSARLQAGPLRIEKRPVELGLFVADLLDRANEFLKVERIETEIQSGLPPITVDPDRLERILLNMLSNALKYSEPNTEVLLKIVAAGGDIVTSVTDRGKGISPDDLPHLFEKYYRARGARQSEGLGLGLYITRMFVEAHGGRIWVESEPGKHTTFFFTLPLLDF